MAKKTTTAKPASNAAPATNAQFVTEESGKVIGPGTNPSQVKFEGNQDGPFYVHAKNGNPVEEVNDHASPVEGWYVRFGGTQAECYAFAGR